MSKLKQLISPPKKRRANAVIVLKRGLKTLELPNGEIITVKEVLSVGDGKIVVRDIYNRIRVIKL